MWRRTLAAAACFVTALACGGAPLGDVATPPPVAPVAAPPAEPATPSAIVQAALDEEDEVVAAYLDDCHHVFPATVDPEGEIDDPSNECTWREFDQNCAPDPSGCWEKGQSCQDQCGDTCSTCQDTCAGVCDACKSACGEDTTCLRACAVGRSACRDTCTSAKATCQSDACPAAETDCYATFESTKAEKCPNCAGIMACVLEAWAQSDWEAASCRDLAGENPECFEWCAPSQ